MLCRCVTGSLVFAVSRSIQAINEAVGAADPVQTLAALRSPGAGLYGVTSECAQTYQDHLAQVKSRKAAEGEGGAWETSLIFSAFSFELKSRGRAVVAARTGTEVSGCSSLLFRPDPVQVTTAASG